MMELKRRENESDLQYHKRLVYGKLADKTLADVDYAELSEYVYGQPYSSDVARRMLYGSKRTLDLMENERRDSVSGSAIAGEIDQKMIELKKERQKFFDQRAAYNKLLRDRSREEELNEIIRDCIASGSLPNLQYKEKECFGTKADCTLLVSLNDLHYGSNIHNAWCEYNSDVCAEMMREYLGEVIRIGKQHAARDVVVWAAGDMISGNIHRSIQVSNKENVIEQIMGVSELIAHFLYELSENFETVRYVSVAGNHSRIEPNKENAITAERLDNLIEWYLAARLQNIQNIHICDDTCRLDDTMSVFSVCGKNYCLVHGDFDKTPAKLQALQQMVRVPLYAVLCGHMHHNQTDIVQGIRTLMAGSFQGMDQFCVEKRIVGSPEQMVCVCDKAGIRCHYDIPLDLPLELQE